MTQLRAIPELLLVLLYLLCNIPRQIDPFIPRPSKSRSSSPETSQYSGNQSLLPSFVTFSLLMFALAEKIESFGRQCFYKCVFNDCSIYIVNVTSCRITIAISKVSNIDFGIQSKTRKFCVECTGGFPCLQHPVAFLHYLAPLCPYFPHYPLRLTRVRSLDITTSEISADPVKRDEPSLDSRGQVLRCLIVYVMISFFITIIQRYICLYLDCFCIKCQAPTGIPLSCYPTASFILGEQQISYFCICPNDSFLSTLALSLFLTTNDDGSSSQITNSNRQSPHLNLARGHQWQTQAGL